MKPLHVDDSVTDESEQSDTLIDGRLHPACADKRTCPECVRMRGDLLTITLRAAVPLWIHEANQHEEGRPYILAQWRAEAVPIICYRADHILYPIPKRAETAAAFNALARGVAALSFHRGGVQVFALTWCAEHSPDGAIPSVPHVCAKCLDQYPDAPNGCTCCTVATPAPPPPAASLADASSRIGSRPVQTVNTGGLT